MQKETLRRNRNCMQKSCTNRNETWNWFRNNERYHERILNSMNKSCSIIFNNFFPLDTQWLVMMGRSIQSWLLLLCSTFGLHYRTFNAWEKLENRKKISYRYMYANVIVLFANQVVDLITVTIIGLAFISYFTLHITLASATLHLVRLHGKKRITKF